jgi:hypothetical protein
LGDHSFITCTAAPRDTSAPPPAASADPEQLAAAALIDGLLADVVELQQQQEAPAAGGPGADADADLTPSELRELFADVSISLDDEPEGGEEAEEGEEAWQAQLPFKAFAHGHHHAHHPPPQPAARSCSNPSVFVLDGRCHMACAGAGERAGGAPPARAGGASLGETALAASAWLAGLASALAGGFCLVAATDLAARCGATATA